MRKLQKGDCCLLDSMLPFHRAYYLQKRELLKKEIVDMLEFKCSKCKSKLYKIIRWKLNDRPDNIGVYCAKCGRWLKFLGHSEEISGKPVSVEIKNQRPSKKSKIFHKPLDKH